MPVLESKPYTYTSYQDSTHTDSRFPGAVFVDSRYSVVGTGPTNSRTGVQNPNWKHQVARGQDATTEYERIWTTGASCRLFAHSWTRTPSLNSTVYGSSYVHYQIGFGLINSADDLALRDLALARLKRRLSSNIGNMDVIVPIAELKDLRGLVRNTAALTTKTIESLISIQRTKGRSAYQWAADAWLNFNFGVKPLISDTQKAAEAISSYLDRSDRSLKLSGTAQKTWVTSTKDTNNTGTFLCPFSRSAFARHTLSYRYIAGLQLNLKSGNNYGFSDHFGLDLGVLPKLAWELTPWSWVVDYFTTVGTYLDDTFVLPSGSTKYLALMKRYRMEARTTGSHYPLSDAFSTTVLLQNFGKDGYLRHVRLNRTKLASLPRASLRFKTVDEIGIGAVNKLLNLSSILVSGGNSRRGR